MLGDNIYFKDSKSSVGDVNSNSISQRQCKGVAFCDTLDELVNQSHPPAVPEAIGDWGNTQQALGGEIFFLT